MFPKIIDFFTSLKLTVVCLALALVLVFIGTLAQVNLGLYLAQERYFQSFFVMWGPEGADWKIPVWPGGYLIGSVLLVNLLTSHFRRFKYTRKKIGILLIHAGLIILLLGQLLTELMQVESFVRFSEGESKNYSVSSRLHELAVIDKSNPEYDEVVAIPESHLETGKEIKHPQLPFTIKIREYAINSEPRIIAPRMSDVKSPATHGIGTRFTFTNLAEVVRMDVPNIPVAQIEIVGPQGHSEGVWTVSNWFSEPVYAGKILEHWSQFLGNAFDQPQTFAFDGKTYQIDLRSTRYYKPYSLQLIDFSHDKYIGTEIPKNFSSRVRLINTDNDENRETLIYMNNPLRYGGETYYQGSFDPKDDRVSILQVVRNPSWLTPYVAVTAVGLGLLIQFLSHFISFSKRRTA